MTDTQYKLKFTIPRDIELGEGLKMNTKLDKVNITTELKKRILVAKGIDAEKTTATIIANDDMHGNVYQTEFEITFNIDADFDKNLEEKDKEEKPVYTKRNNFLISKSIEEINKLIRVHQFVNEKYFVFPISKSELSDINIEFPEKGGMYIMSPSIKMITLGNKEIVENTKKVMEFINTNQRIIGPIYMFGYAKQFYKMEIYRIAITEAQAAIEYLLDLIIKYGLSQKEDKSLEFYDKTKDKTDFVDEKLGIYLRLATGASIEKEFKDIKSIRSAVKLRNEIVHGSKSNIDKTEAFNAMKVYEELFKYLIEFAKYK